MASFIRSPVFNPTDRQRAKKNPKTKQKRRHPPSTALQKEMGSSAPLCDIYARVPTERRAAFSPKKQMQRFVKRICTGDTHFESVTRNPESRCRSADARRIREKLRLSPYCCCYLSPQCERFPCITDDSQQNGRECRRATFS